MTIQNNRLPSIAARLDETVEEAMEDAARFVAESAQARVPVATGKLRDAIHVDRMDDDTVAVVAGNTDAWYGHIVEGGGAKTSPKPFLVPAFEANRKLIEQRISDAIERMARG